MSKRRVIAITAGLGEAVVDAAVAGLVVGLIETGLVIRRGAPAVEDLTAVIVAAVGLTVLPVTVVGTALIVVARLLGRHPLLVATGARLRAPGPARVEALVVGLFGLVALGGAWWVGFRMAVHLHVHRRLPEAAGLMGATTTVVAVLGAGLLVAAAAPPLGRWLGRRSAVVRATSGWNGAAAAAIAVTIAAFAADRFIVGLIPSWDPVPAYVRALATIAVLAAAVLRPARRLGRGGCAGVAAAAAAVVLAAPFIVAHHDPARGVVMARGVIADSAMRTLLAMFDGDGDGFAAALGTVDCDDGAAAVHPGAVEHAGNGVDDDCSGGDADLAALVARRGARPSATVTAPHHDVVLITIDSLRADHTSPYGYRRATTPALAALAARGVRFDRAYCASPTTRFAMPALLFGRHPHTLPFVGSRAWPLLADHRLPTLAAELRAAGYRTATILARAGLPLSPSTFAGFDEVIAVEQHRPERNADNAAAVADRALAWLAMPSSGGPRFLWVHFIDPHYPYETPPGGPGFDGDHRAYDAEIAFADAALGRIAAALDPARAIVVVTGDHGEAFFDHHQRFHGSSLYEEETRVPLVIAVPGGAARHAAAPVSHVDLAPTLLDLVGLTTPAGMSGASLAALVLRGESPAARTVVTAVLPSPQSPRSLVAAHVGDAKIILDLDAWTVEVYDLARDPGERDPSRAGATVDRLRRALEDAVTHDLAVAP